MTNSYKQLVAFNEPNWRVSADTNSARGPSQNNSPLLQRAALYLIVSKHTM